MKTIIYCSWLLLLAPLAPAQDVSLGKGRSLFSLTYSQFEADRYFDFEDRDDPIVVNDRVSDYESQPITLQYEYGWTNDMTLVIRTDYLSHEVSNDTETFKADDPSGYYVALRQRLNPRGSDTHVFAETGMLINEGSDADQPAIGTGGTDWFALMSFRQQFLPTTGGFNFDFGYRFRDSGADDEYFLDTAINLSFLKVVNTRVSYHVLESKKDNKISYDVLEYPGERGSQTMGVELVRSMRNNNVNIAAGYHKVIKARNQFAIDGWKLSFSWRR